MFPWWCFHDDVTMTMLPWQCYYDNDDTISNSQCIHNNQQDQITINTTTSVSKLINIINMAMLGSNYPYAQ